jgi:class 3 adenylate cyclase
MEPQIQFCTTSDGASIAYFVVGEGPPIVYAANFFGIDLYRALPAAQSEDQRLVDAGYRVSRYEGRGIGMSDRSQTDFSLAARVRDLAAVITSLGDERVALIGFQHGSPTAIAYAAAHPDRVSHLALYDAYASGARMYELVPTLNLATGLRDMAPEQWEFYTLSVANAAIGFSDGELARRVAEAMRGSMSPETMLAFRSATQNIDVTAMLTSLTTPTLVVHREGSRFASQEASRDLARQISNARLVAVPMRQAHDAIIEFLADGDEPVTSAPARHAVSSGTAVILFADIADSTALTERLGDAAFREKARELDGALRSAISSNGGTAIEGKLLGDGVLATFGAARSAIACAQEMHRLAAGAGGGLDPRPLTHDPLLLHIGIHAGDVIREENNVYGGAVNIASRVASEAAAGETLVSATVRELARTSAGVEFEDRGERALKGVGEPVRVWAVKEQGTGNKEQG